MAIPIYIPANCVQGFPLLHILADTCYLLSFIIIAIAMIITQPVCLGPYGGWGRLGASVHRSQSGVWVYEASSRASREPGYGSRPGTKVRWEPESAGACLKPEASGALRWGRA